MNINIKASLVLGLIFSSFFLQAQSWQEYYSQGRAAIKNEDYKGAATVLLKARIMASEQMDNKNETYRTIVSNLANAYFLLGDYGNATVNYRDLERAFKEDRATSTKEYADMLEALAKSYEAEKKIPNAANYYQQALTAREKIQGAGHKDYYETMLLFANLCMKVKKYDVAGSLYTKLYDFGKTGYKSEPAKYREIVKNYADLYFYTHKFEKAIELYDEHKKAAKAASADKSEYVYAVKNTAEAYQKLDKKDEMIANYKEFLILYKEVNKDKKEDYLKEVDGVIELLKEQNAYLAAVDVLKTKNDFIAAESMDKVNLLNEIGINYKKAEKFAEAEKSFSESIVLLKKLGKEKDALYPASMDELGRLKLAMNKTDEAEKIFKDAQEIRKTSLGENHQDYATGLDSLASFYVLKENYSEADTLLSRAISLKKEHLGKNHAAYGNSLALLGNLRLKLKDYKEAERLLIESSVVTSKYYGRMSLENAVSTKRIADLYKVQEKYSDAIKYYRQSLSIFEGIGKGKSHYTTSIHNSIKESSEAQE
ncbi:tetratricopeptide repeat protein [Chondrinema litorale]|uniref:tetratricopeptide repeat protein n=1 Tax=Chondrinema litorale TaxID=2994555 RepID=UPI0025427277|nr:tetratricopeptide repeat protein [Chondrinema litorale]UZR95891.1 tetratricopeptide repeat protein [Chondrinema litorale]